MSYLRGYLGASTTKPRNSSKISTNHATVCSKFCPHMGPNVLYQPMDPWLLGRWTSGAHDLFGPCGRQVLSTRPWCQSSTQRQRLVETLMAFRWRLELLGSIPARFSRCCIYIWNLGREGIQDHPISSWKGEKTHGKSSTSVWTLSQQLVFLTPPFGQMYFMSGSRYLQETNSISWFYPRLFGEMMQIGELILKLV